MIYNSRVMITSRLSTIAGGKDHNYVNPLYDVITAALIIISVLLIKNQLKCHSAGKHSS